MVAEGDCVVERDREVVPEAERERVVDAHLDVEGELEGDLDRPGLGDVVKEAEAHRDAEGELEGDLDRAVLGEEGGVAEVQGLGEGVGESVLLREGEREEERLRVRVEESEGVGDTVLLSLLLVARGEGVGVTLAEGEAPMGERVGVTVRVEVSVEDMLRVLVVDAVTACCPVPLGLTVGPRGEALPAPEALTWRVLAPFLLGVKYCVLPRWGLGVGKGALWEGVGEAAVEGERGGLREAMGLAEERGSAVSPLEDLEGMALGEGSKEGSSEYVAQWRVGEGRRAVGEGVGVGRGAVGVGRPFVAEVPRDAMPVPEEAPLILALGDAAAEIPGVGVPVGGAALRVILRGLAEVEGRAFETVGVVRRGEGVPVMLPPLPKMRGVRVEMPEGAAQAVGAALRVGRVVGLTLLVAFSESVSDVLAGIVGAAR